jgi:hypothetical protein
MLAISAAKSKNRLSKMTGQLEVYDSGWGGVVTLAHLDGYAVIPREVYESLVANQVGQPEKSDRCPPV